MTSLEWIALCEAYERFEAKAKGAGFHTAEIAAMGDELFDMCPIPQPKPSQSYFEEYGGDNHGRSEHGKKYAH